MWKDKILKFYNLRIKIESGNFQLSILTLEK